MYVCMYVCMYGWRWDWALGIYTPFSRYSLDLMRFFVDTCYLYFVPFVHCHYIIVFDLYD